MAERLFESVSAHISTSPDAVREKPSPDSPFRMLVLGDFSGRANRGVADADALRARRPQTIDRDNFEQVLGKLGARLGLQLFGDGGDRIDLEFASLEDFHPDRLYDRNAAFQSLRALRKRLADPKTFADAKAEIADWTATAPPQSADAAERPAPAGGGAALLDEMLGGGGQTGPQSGDRQWNALLRRLVAPYVVPAADPMQAQLTGYVDTATGALMRAVLHDPGFQALEAAWRALWLLVRGLETGTDLKLYLLDVGKAELCGDAETAGDVRESGLHRLLVEQAVETFGGESWSLVVGAYTFDDSAEDAAALGRIGAIARQAGAPFIAAASPRIVGCDSLAEAPDPDRWQREQAADAPWPALRRTPQAQSVGLLLPRFLLRLPYGASTEPIERFVFEEMADPPQHAHYLWGNPCFACALLLGRSFSQSGWDFPSALELNVDGLPLHTYRQAGETRIKPCAEIWLTERAANRMIECGAMPLASLKDTDSVRLVRLQSIATPASRLAARWN
ncbi:MAG TPA: type VI secretion system contractile sheath large subunit [Burkholderiales bacterium]|nr:type VI secretion system contractile sheath large subunit [Burkholderiales bacterium]